MKQLSFGQTLRLIQAESRGAGRRFVFFVLCLAIGVGAVMMIKSFGNLLERCLKSREILATAGNQGDRLAELAEQLEGSLEDVEQAAKSSLSALESLTQS